MTGNFQKRLQTHAFQKDMIVESKRSLLEVYDPQILIFNTKKTENICHYGVKQTIIRALSIL